MKKVKKMSENIIKLDKFRVKPRKITPDEFNNMRVDREDLEIAADLVSLDINIGITNLFSTFNIDITNPRHEIDSRHLTKLISKMVNDHFNLNGE